MLLVAELLDQSEDFLLQFLKVGVQVGQARAKLVNLLFYHYGIFSSKELSKFVASSHFGPSHAFVEHRGTSSTTKSSNRKL